MLKLWMFVRKFKGLKKSLLIIVGLSKKHKEVTEAIVYFVNAISDGKIDKEEKKVLIQKCADIFKIYV